MTDETNALKEKIHAARQNRQTSSRPSEAVTGYNAAVTVLTDLLGSIFVGLAIGVLLQKIFGTSVLLTGALTILGGVAGLWTTARYALRLDKKEDKK